jgi:NADPH-dependent 7-cyano-7-deazaguanine reductase QueF
MLKTLDIKNTERDLIIKLTTNFMAICPVDNNPDFYEIEIMFTPGRHTLDIISLRHYLLQYRSQSIIAENLAVIIANSLNETLNPKMLSVKLVNDTEGIEIEIQQKKEI